MILLIHPPVAKACEPPAGIARLAGALGSQRIDYHLLDANLEGLIHLLDMPAAQGGAESRWTQRALKNRKADLSRMKHYDIYRNVDRYRRVVRDLSRVLGAVSPAGCTIGLANYDDQRLSPLRSADLLAAAEKPEQNPFFTYFETRFRQLFRTGEPSIVGISLNYLSQALCAFAIIGMLRRILPHSRIVLGGGLVTTWMRRPGWKNPFAGLVDHLVDGPGEHQLLGLIGSPPQEQYPFITDYSHLNVTDYLSPGFVLPFSASSGCYWKQCAFCPEKAEDNPYLPLPPAEAIKHIRVLTEQNKPVLMHVLDNAISPALLTEFASAKPGVPWYGFARIGAHLTDPDFCRALKKSGCVMLKLGIESGDQSVLDALGKGIRVDTVSAVLFQLKKAGIATYAYLLFGTPAEDEIAARKTLDFTVRHSHLIDFLNLAIFNMPRFSETGQNLPQMAFSEGDLSLYTDFVHPAGWRRKQVRRFLDSEFRRHPSIAGIINNDPFVFTSNHAPFFVMERDRKAQH